MPSVSPPFAAKFHPSAAVGVYAFPYKNLEGLLAFPAMFVGLIILLFLRPYIRPKVPVKAQRVFIEQKRV